MHARTSLLRPATALFWLLAAGQGCHLFNGLDDVTYESGGAGGTMTTMTTGTTGATTTGTEPDANPVEDLAAGFGHTCALFRDHSVKCWGDNRHGQLGLGDRDDRGDDPGEMGADLPPVNLGTGKAAVQLAAGRFHTCARLDDGGVKCWGRNDFGQLGLGGVANRGDNPGEMGDDLDAVDLGADAKAIDLAAGAFHACALLDGGSIMCWGHNEDGQLGVGTEELRSITGAVDFRAVDLGTDKTAVHVAAGYGHTCAVLADRSLKCWGRNDEAQLGLGDLLDRGDESGEMGDALPPVDLGSSATPVQVAAGESHTCVRLQQGAIKCWGQNKSGQVGLGVERVFGGEPGQMGDALPAVDLGTGRTAFLLGVGSDHTCALLHGPAEDTVKCWGFNYHGQLGQGDQRAIGAKPDQMGDSLLGVDLGTGKTPVRLAVGGQHTCALLNDGSVKCWGGNGSGQLGQGDHNGRGEEGGEMGDQLPAVSLD